MIKTRQLKLNHQSFKKELTNFQFIIKNTKSPNIKEPNKENQ